ncbi:symmetrical bis(5'-nucleosyl)-tetraphosphatase [Corticibacter populi]|uniref:bis(5'-nucleosyl)-tetraphosphatase (symmetrical) n=1 Tax=Corticibacter populi TaxID=1550736 RepID=A0A3M6QSA0_9BURK|nr:symmetrical bis(5'-nucleosyl)-tetraphosphatase [Corticibacter populi]RMX05906.1 symmetrical bis(5'-nucleosyl)-tetraphosphatase [Corticibacter populi]RZS30774.1 bis(5'nucleosyl)-tetraphosphatase ApaH [Corticibacter populi]
MSIYCIGDVQGCDAALGRLLETIDFSPSRDQVFLLGDLVNRGPQSLQVLQRCMRADGAIAVILGNHDLHLLARFHGARKAGRRDTLDDVLSAPDCPVLIDWLRRQPLVRQHMIGAESLLMVHAGLLPAWNAAQALALAQEVEDTLAGPDCAAFMHSMYGNKPRRWRDTLQGPDRLRVIVNAFTRLRFCSAEGRMDFDSAEGADQAPPGLMPWFEVPGRASRGTTIAFGHWSTLGVQDRCNVLALDSGCVWGGCLSALRFGDTLAARELIQVKCQAAQQPG